MITAGGCHCRCPVTPITFDILLAKRPNRPAEIEAITDKKGCGIVLIPVFGETISFAYLSRILRSIRTIVSLHKGGIDHVTCCGKPSRFINSAIVLNTILRTTWTTFPFSLFFTYRGVAQILRHDLFGFRGSAWVLGLWAEQLLERTPVQWQMYRVHAHHW